MVKKIFFTVIAVVLLLAIFFAPIPKSPYRDGGTREYSALTYKIVDWNRLTDDGVYEATKVYWFPNNFKSIDALWEQEKENVGTKLLATVESFTETEVVVEAVSNGAQAVRRGVVVAIVTRVEENGKMVVGGCFVHAVGILVVDNMKKRLKS